MGGNGNKIPSGPPRNKFFVFRVYGPPEIIRVPVKYDRYMLPSRVRAEAAKAAQTRYIKKHQAPLVELLEEKEESTIEHPIKSEVRKFGG